jgi:hypothetical protein
MRKVLPYINQITEILKGKGIPVGSKVTICNLDTTKSMSFVVKEEGDYHLDFQGYSHDPVVIKAGNKITVLQ